MRCSRLAAGAAAALALAVPAAGCGGEDNDAFFDDYNAAVDELSDVNTRIGEAGGAAGRQSNAKIARDFTTIAATAERTRARLRAIEPPEDAREEYDALLAALGQGVRDLRGVARAARNNDPAAARRAKRGLRQSGAEITRAENELRRAVGE